MDTVSYYHLVVTDCLLSKDFPQVMIPAVRHVGFSFERFFYLLV